MKVLVTGASGFIGQHLVVALRNVGLEVRAAGRHRLDIDGVEWTPLSDVGCVDWKTISADMDVIVHLAAIAHTREAPFEKLQAVNRDAPVALARALRSDQFLIFVSSIRAVIGASSPLEIDEEASPAPVCAYGRMKLSAETEIKTDHPNTCILRPVPVYGEGAKYNMRMLARMARSGMPLPVRQFDQNRSYLSVENFCSAVIFCIMKQLRGTYHLSDPDTATVSQLVSFFRDALGHPRRVFRLPLAAMGFLKFFPAVRSATQAAAGSLIARPFLLVQRGWQPPHKSTRDGVYRWATGGERAANRKNYTRSFSRIVG